MRQKVAPGRPKVRKVLPKASQNGPQISEMGSRSRSGGDFLPNGPTFIKPAQACTDCMFTPPGEPHFCTLWPPKVILKPDGKARVKQHPQKYETNAKSSEKLCPKAPRMAPWGTINRSKFSLGSARAARGCPKRLQGNPPRKKGGQNHNFSLKTQTQTS